MAEKKSWSKSDVFTLISQWQLYPELWDAKNIFFRNRNKKKNALKDIATILNTTEHEISRKLHILRTQFHNEIRRKQIKKIDNEVGENYQTTWEYFDPMKFILPCDDTNPISIDNFEKSSENVIEIEDSENSIDNDESFDQEEQRMRKKTKRNIDETEHNDLLRKAVHIMENPADELNIFGDFVADALRNVKSREYQRQLKLTIQRAIIQFSEIDRTDIQQNSSKDLRKVEASKTSAASTDEVFKPKRWTIKELSFLNGSSSSYAAPDLSSESQQLSESENMDCDGFEEDVIVQSSNFFKKRKRLEKNVNKTQIELLNIALEYIKKNDGEKNAIAKIWALKLTKMKPNQRIWAEKFINDILTEGELGTLHRHYVYNQNFPTTSSSTPSVKDPATEDPEIFDQPPTILSIDVKEEPEFYERNSQIDDEIYPRD